MASAFVATALPKTVPAADNAGACSALQRRHELPLFLENGFDSGASGPASLWKWLASTLVAKKITTAHRTTSQDLLQTVIDVFLGAKYRYET
jgi:hypothetical protein